MKMPRTKGKRGRTPSQQASSSASYDPSEREDSSSSTELNSDITYTVLKEKGAKRLKRCSETLPKQIRKIETVMDGLFKYVNKLEERMDERMKTQEERMKTQEERLRKEIEVLRRKVEECEQDWQGNLYNIILLTLHPQLQIASKK